MPAIRVLLIDDSPLIRLGLRAALEDRREVEIVGESGSAAEGVESVVRLKPDVVLLDLRLPDKPGYEACREIVRGLPKVKVIILTSSTDERNVHDAIAAGAQGYLLKENDGASLVDAITRVAAGDSVIDRSLTSQVISLVKGRSGPTAAERVRSLSYQEQRVVALLARGLTNKEIGEQLGLTEKTVKNYLATVFDKLGISRRAQAAALFVEASRQP